MSAGREYTERAEVKMNRKKDISTKITGQSCFANCEKGTKRQTTESLKEEKLDDWLL